MKRHGICMFTFACCLSLALPAKAQDNPWNGSWKMDLSTLKYDGPTMTVATDADGFTITRGGKADPKVVCNGKPNPQNKGIVTTCVKTSTGYALQSIRDDKSTRKVKVVISPDGNTLTQTVEISPVKEPPFTVIMVSKKVSGGNGSPVVWKETSFQEPQDTGLLTIMVKGGSVDFKETDAEKPITCKLDGTPTQLSGLRTMSAELVGSHTLKVTYSSKGEVQRVNTFVLSPDGKTVKETDTTPAPSPSTMTVMFHKA
jgi:hypothetical protein